MSDKRVVIVGGGFAGINAAKKLRNAKGLQVILIDKRNHHLFQPLLYQVAMAGLSPAEIAAPIRAIFRGVANIEVIMAEVEGADLNKKVITTDIGDYPYDYAIFACGSTLSYFGNEDWEKFAPGLKNIEQATEIRRRLLVAFERAESTEDPELKKSLLTFVVVGGGPTGVELAGAIGEISKYTLGRDFRRIDPSRTRIILIEAGARVLPAFDSKLSQKTARALEHLGVQIWTSSRVTRIDREGLLVGNEYLNAHTILWAAGVGPTPFSQSLECKKDRQGRVHVGSDLSLEGHREVFCVGDQAAFVDSKHGVLPGLAPVAIQQGSHAAKQILNDNLGKSREEFQYRDKGKLATIGRRMAIMEIGKIKNYGFLAWLVWLFVHIYYLIGFKNRIFVFWQWAWHYVSYSKGARLIIHKKWQQFTKDRRAP